MIVPVFRHKLQPRLRLAGAASRRGAGDFGRGQQEGAFGRYRLGRFFVGPRIHNRQHMAVRIDEQVVVAQRLVDNRVIVGHV
ncbi:hypothetical protein D3C73_1536110 [compost metagenome]